jgi:hypothetical protein
MHRNLSPFGVLDDPVLVVKEESNNNNADYKDEANGRLRRPLSANGYTRTRSGLALSLREQQQQQQVLEEKGGKETSTPTSSMTVALRDGYGTLLRQQSNTPTDRPRPKSAGAIRTTSSSSPWRLSQTRRPVVPDSLDLVDGYQGVDNDLHHDRLVGDDGELEPLTQTQTKALTVKARRRRKKAGGLVTINDVQLSEAEWERIFAKYQISGVDGLRFSFLKKGRGSTTKLDHIGKNQLNKSLTTGACDLQTNDDWLKAPLIDSPTPEDKNQQYLKAYRKKQSNIDASFALTLEKDLQSELTHLQRCIEECNQFADFLQQPQRYIFRDSRSVRKLADASKYKDWNDVAAAIIKKQTAMGVDASEKSTQALRIIPVDKFHAEHNQLLSEFKLFSKYHPAESLDRQVVPLQSSHFIGVNDLYQAATKLECGEPSKVVSGTVPVEVSSATPTKSPHVTTSGEDFADYNELRRRNETIAQQHLILQEFEDLQTLIDEQISHILDQGWNSTLQLFSLNRTEK